MAKLAERYSNALLELSKESDSLESDFEYSTLMRDMFKSDDVQAFLTHPHISNTAKHELFENALADKVSEHLMGFLYLMVQKNRETIIVPVLNDFIDRVDRHLGRVEARVVSAQPLNEEQIESIRTLLSKQINMQVKIKLETDPDVIGGFYILVDGHIFDGTVRSKLNKMRESLKRGGYQ